MQRPNGRTLTVFLMTELGKPQKNVPVRQRCDVKDPRPNFAITSAKTHQGQSVA